MSTTSATGTRKRSHSIEPPSSGASDPPPASDRAGADPPPPALALEPSSASLRSPSGNCSVSWDGAVVVWAGPAGWLSPTPTATASMMSESAATAATT